MIEGRRFYSFDAPRCRVVRLRNRNPPRGITTETPEGLPQLTLNIPITKLLLQSYDEYARTLPLRCRSRMRHKILRHVTIEKEQQ